MSRLDHGWSRLGQDSGSRLGQDGGSRLGQDGGSRMGHSGGGSRLGHSGSSRLGQQQAGAGWGIVAAAGEDDTGEAKGESLVERGQYVGRVRAENVHHRHIVDFFRRLPGFLECGDLRNQPPPEHVQDVTRQPPPVPHVGPLGQAIGQGRESALESL